MNQLHKEKINPAMLTLARMSRGKSIKELSVDIGCTPREVNQYEHGKLISDETLGRISKILNYPIEFFTDFGRETYLCGCVGQRRIRKYFACLDICKGRHTEIAPVKELTEKQKLAHDKFIKQLRKLEIID